MIHAWHGWNKNCTFTFFSFSILADMDANDTAYLLYNENSSQTDQADVSTSSYFSGYLAYYFIKMLIISYKFQERSEGADEILIWIPQTSVAIGSTIFFISVFHQFILTIKKN